MHIPQSVCFECRADESEALAFSRVLVVLLSVCLVVVALALVGFGHALAGASEANCDMLAAIRFKRKCVLTSTASFGARTEHGLLLRNALLGRLVLEVCPG